MSLFDETERRPLSVSELTSQVRGALENRFASVWVEGEISNFRAPASGHWYFTIKDEAAQLRASCFRGANSRIRFRPTDGLQVRARGRLTVYEPRGDYELVVEGLDPVGAGALRVAFEQMRDRLAAEGLFAEELKRPLPLLPRRVGVVTSPTGAAVHDILRVLSRRTRTVNILLVPVRVQGEGAGAEIARAVAMLNAHHRAAILSGRAGDGVDAIIVGRGGGSAEDLWAFNEEEVARAIRASTIPVISAVGHETDFCIADFAADVRAATPSAAAELVAAREDEVAAAVDALTRELLRTLSYRLMNERARLQEAAMSRGFDDARARLNDASRVTAELSHRLEKLIARVRESARKRLGDASCRLSPAKPAARAARARTRLALVRATLERTAASRLEEARARLGVAAASLDALSPLAVLRRGYAIAEDEAGSALRAARETREGRRVRVRLGEGALRCRVEGVEGV
ncbi:MAG: exodeoxyribonuclease VII large subunit [Acidobacteria bacterium]|nr:exodeoxyribonuclease VII large subunit [Acidobacteriota bacterium]MCA1640803.1 exodeoxyribonuclease VII large subunit [Acidobacteriota bacterium]